MLLFLSAALLALEQYDGPGSCSSRGNLAGADLPPGELHVMSAASTAALDGSIVIASPQSLHPADVLYPFSRAFMGAHDAFSRWISSERGGVRLGGKRFGVKFVYVGDGSSELNFTAHNTKAATAHAVASPIVDFVVGGYTSDLNNIAAQQAYAAGKLMITWGASATSVFTQNNLTFSTNRPASSFLYNGVVAIADAARRADDAGTLSRCPSGNGRRCVDSLVFGFLETDNLFGRAVCDEAELKPAFAASRLEEPSRLIKGIVPTVPDDAQIDGVLRNFSDRGVNVIVSCGYLLTVEAVIASLERLDYSPLATVAWEDLMSTERITKGWWQGDYLTFTAGTGRASPITWKNEGVNEEDMTRGEFTNMTAHEYLQYWGEAEDEFGAGEFIALAVLMEAVERAQSVDSNAVAAALEETALLEFALEPVSFDENHQLNVSREDTNILQGRPIGGRYKEEIVYPPRVETAPLRFPAPTWAQRRCRVLGVAFATFDSGTSAALIPEWWLREECSGHGTCNGEGACECDANWAGEECEREEPSAVTITLIALGGVFGLVILVMCGFGGRRQYLRWRTAIAAQKAAEAQRIQRIRDAVNCMQLLNFPLCVMRFSQFKALGKLVPHEEARDGGMLRILDQWGDAMDFARSNPICFNSHQWLGLASPDPRNVHYPAMVRGCQALCRKHGLEEEELWVWVDFFSIPQRNKASQLCAINSIAVYASCCKYFLVCAIDTMHEDTKRPCNPLTYSRRGWCRLEQWSFMGVHGVAHMYLLDSAGRELVQLKDKRGWLEETIRVMDADFTMESDKPKLVDVILGLYAFMKVCGDATHVQELQELLKEHKEEVFPVKHFGGLELLLEQELELARSGGDQGGGSAFSEKDFDAVLLAREAFSRVQGQMLPEDLARRLSTPSSVSARPLLSRSLTSTRPPPKPTHELVAGETLEIDITPSVSSDSIRSSGGEIEVSQA